MSKPGRSTAGLRTCRCWKSSAAPRSAPGESLIDPLFERWPDSWSTDKRTARAAMLGLTAFGTWQALTDAGRFTVQDAVEFILGVLDRCLLK